MDKNKRSCFLFGPIGSLRRDLSRATAVWASSLEGSSVRPPQRGGRTKKTNPRDLRALKRRKRLNRAKLQQTPERTYREDTADRKTTEYVTLHAVQVFLHVRE